MLPEILIPEKREKEKQPIRIMNPEEAARHVFGKLITSEKDRRYVKHIGGLYTGGNYPPSSAANAVLAYGLTIEWFRPDNEFTREELRRGLRVLFNIELGKEEEVKDPESDFVDGLGELITDLVTGRIVINDSANK